MSVVQALWLAVLQGFSELFPISSIGQTVLVPKLLGWNIDQQSRTFLPFLVTLHLGTAAALLLFFWRDWLALVSALLRSVMRGKLTSDPDEHLAWMVVFGTIPTGIIGLFLETPLRRLFAAPIVAAVFLIVNGFIMFFGERLRRGAPPSQGLDSISWRTAVRIGFVQSAALVPGISRSGTTIVAGLLAGLKHEAVARFSFLLATPIILAAGLLEVPVLLGADGRSMLALALIGGIVAGVTAWLSVKFLMRYFEFGRLDPFAYYCWAFGALSLAILLVRR
ncbi:MAG TPA: undecaprenyl-diphosphate phosphatase [Chloroflexota bacterium]